MDAQIKAKHEKFIYPIVRVVAPNKRGGASGGSGIVVYSAPTSAKSKEFETYILTNHHVIAPLIDVQEKWHPTVGRDIKIETRSEGMVEFFGYENLSRIIDAMAKRADLVAWDDQKDLALLRLKATQKIDYVAPIIKPADVEKKLFIFTPVYTVGCGLGVHIRLTLLSLLRALVLLPPLEKHEWHRLEARHPLLRQNRSNYQKLREDRLPTQSYLQGFHGLLVSLHHTC